MSGNAKEVKRVLDSIKSKQILAKYRYHVLQGDVQKRCRDLLIQICNSEDVNILKGVVCKDHVHMHIEYPLS